MLNVKLSVVLLALLQIVASQDTGALIFARPDSFPICGQSCLVNAQLGDCALTDTACLCNSQEFISSINQCILSSCSGSDIQDAESASQALCAQAGVTLTSTPAAASGSGSS